MGSQQSAMSRLTLSLGKMMLSQVDQRDDIVWRVPQKSAQGVHICGGWRVLPYGVCATAGVDDFSSHKLHGWCRIG
ncbi:hypothetical protein AVS7_00136 [Acidovorax sp. MR-S7]|nr:hypothetical protein AVS7_00136 [Acidovorax sp. MR-S7]